MINIVGKQNITLKLTFRSTFAATFAFPYTHVCLNTHCDVIISNVKYNSHFNVMVYPLSADDHDHNQHLRGNVKKTTANNKLS